MVGPDTRPTWSEQSGQVLVIFAVSMLVLVGFAAMAVDVGYYLAERRSVQNATDSAALAAARLALRDDTNNLESRAQAFISNNGYPNATVDIDFEEDDDVVRVTVEQEVEQFFLGAVYDGDWSVTTEAAARLAPQEVPFALITLGHDPYCSDPTGVRLSGAAMNLQLIGGGIGTNACVNVDGNLVASIDGNIEAYGTISHWVENWDLTGTALENQGLIDDPFEDFAASNDPMASSYCQEQRDDEDIDDDEDPVVLQPGYYPSSTDLTFSANTEVEMERGIYCIDTPFQLGPGAHSSLDGTDGVLIYLMDNGSFAPGNGDYQLTSYSEDWADLVIWSASCADLDMHGNGEMAVNGVIYAPCSFLEMGGNTSQQVVNGQIVAHDVWLHGNVTFNIDAGLEYTADPLRVFLVE